MIIHSDRFTGQADPAAKDPQGRPDVPPVLDQQERLWSEPSGGDFEIRVLYTFAGLEDLISSWKIGDVSSRALAEEIREERLGGQL